MIWVKIKQKRGSRCIVRGVCLFTKVISEQASERDLGISRGQCLERVSLPYRGTSKYEGFVWTFEWSLLFEES